MGEANASSVANASGNIWYGAQDGRWYSATPLREITVSTTRPNTVLQSIYRGQQEFMNSSVTQGVIGVLLFFTPVSYEAAGAKFFGTKAIDGAAHVVARDGVKAGGTKFFEGAKYSEKILRQMSKADDISHAFPKSVDGYATKFGQWSTKVGADGKVYQWLEIPGSYGGRIGVFEYIKDANGIINHRYLKLVP